MTWDYSLFFPGFVLPLPSSSPSFVVPGTHAGTSIKSMSNCFAGARRVQYSTGSIPEAWCKFSLGPAAAWDQQQQDFSPQASCAAMKTVSPLHTAEMEGLKKGDFSP